MKLLARILFLALALAWAQSDDDAAVALDRCLGLEMDAVVVNEEGIPYFIKGKHIFKGFDGRAQRSNESFAELADLEHVDAGFRMHNTENPNDHDHLFLFSDSKVFRFHKHKLQDGYPKEISEEFAGIPEQLDAAVVCPSPDCDEDSVIFFKGDDIYHYNVKSKAVDMKEFKAMPNCTSAFRFMEQYYCFHGHKFSKFNPKTGEVDSKHTRDARDYFMRCSKFSEQSDHVERERCSRAHLDAMTSDNAGNLYAFRGHHYIRKDGDTVTSDTVESSFKEVQSEVDAVFTYEEHLYMIKGDNLFVYKVGETHTHLDGYPKSVKEELGIDGPVDAAFVCEGQDVAHLIKGQKIYDVNLKESTRAATNERSIPLFKKVDAASCDAGGVNVVVGNHFYNFPSPMLFVASRAMPEQHRVSLEKFGCDH